MLQGQDLKKIHKKNKSTSDLAINAITNVADAVAPFVTSFSVQDNKKMVSSLTDRAHTAEAIIRNLKLIDEKKGLRDKIYHQDFVRLDGTVHKIKRFIEDISQVQGIKKYLSANSIKEKLDELFQEYDNRINSLNSSLNVDALLKSEENQKQLEMDIQDISSSLSILVKKINKLEITGQERQELKEENLQEKSIPSLERFTECSKQSKLIEESLTKKEQEITDLEILIEYKQDKIKTNDEEIQSTPFNDEEKIKLERQITDLKNQIVSLQTQLIEKGKELTNLKQENNKLIEECLFYLTLIKSFQEKQKELEEKKKELIENKENLSEKELDNFCQLKEEYRSLEKDLEEIIIVEQLLTKIERPKKRFWKPEEMLVDQIIIDNWDEVLAEIRGYKLPKEKISFEEIVREIIKNCDKNTVKSVLLISRTNKDNSGLVNTYNEATPKGKEIIEKMLVFLEAKQIFLNTRQGTIGRLGKCYNDFKKSVETGKYALFTQGSNQVSSIGGIIPDLGGIIVKAVGVVCSGTVNIFKNNAWKNCRNNFEKFLANDEKKLFWFKEKYLSLITIVWDNKEQPISSVIIEILELEKRKKESSFNEKYNIYRIGGNIHFKGESTLELEEMKKMITLLDSNLEDIKSKLEEEKSKFCEHLETYIQTPKIQISDHNNLI